MRAGPWIALKSLCSQPSVQDTRKISLLQKEEFSFRSIRLGGSLEITWEAKVQCAELDSINLSFRLLFCVSKEKGKPRKVGGGVLEAAVKWPGGRERKSFCRSMWNRNRYFTKVAWLNRGDATRIKQSINGGCLRETGSGGESLCTGGCHFCFKFSLCLLNKSLLFLLNVESLG